MKVLISTRSSTLRSFVLGSVFVLATSSHVNAAPKSQLVPIGEPWRLTQNDTLKEERPATLQGPEYVQLISDEQETNADTQTSPPPSTDTAGKITDVGIQFDQMPIGTKLTIRLRGFSTYLVEEEFMGSEDGFFVMKIRKINDDDSRKELTKAFYDAEGRHVYSERFGKTNTYEPYNCRYVLGECEMIYTYYNSLTDKYVTNTSKRVNRIEDDVLYLGIFDALGDLYEVPMTLGPFNLRVSNEYKDALGDDAGYSFVDLHIPN